MRLAVVLLALVVACTGCTRRGAALGRGVVTGLALVVRLAALAEHRRHGTPVEEREPDRGDDGDEERTATAAPAAPVDAAPAQTWAAPAESRGSVRSRFDLGGAYGALMGVDLGSCRAAGLSPGYGHVVVAFAEDGAPTEVDLDLPAGSAPAARGCVERAYRSARVARFEGLPVNVRRAFFVAAPAL